MARGAGTERLRVAVLDDYQGVAAQFADWSQVQARADVAFFRDNISDRAALVERLLPFDILCLMRERTRLDRQTLSALPRLKLIVTPAMRNAAVDLADAIERGVTICGTGAVQTGTPELTWGLLIALARGLVQEIQGVRDGRWQLGIGKDLHGSTLGIIGLGRVGSRVAAVGRAFGMRVIAWSPHLTPQRAADGGAEFATKEALFAQSDFITLSLALRQQTRGIVGAADLARMKPTAYFINTARGPLVDEDALVDALQQRRIAGAAIDAHAQEPLPMDHPFRRLDNVLLTPHIGYVTEATYEGFYREMVEDVLAWMDGSPIRIVTPEAD